MRTTLLFAFVSLFGSTARAEFGDDVRTYNGGKLGIFTFESLRACASWQSPEKGDMDCAILATPDHQRWLINKVLEDAQDAPGGRFIAVQFVDGKPYIVGTRAVLEYDLRKKGTFKTVLLDNGSYGGFHFFRLDGDRTFLITGRGILEKRGAQFVSVLAIPLADASHERQHYAGCGDGYYLSRVDDGFIRGLAGMVTRDATGAWYFTAYIGPYAEVRNCVNTGGSYEFSTSRGETIRFTAPQAGSWERE